jgi:hypothetical protein
MFRLKKQFSQLALAAVARPFPIPVLDPILTNFLPIARGIKANLTPADNDLFRKTQGFPIWRKPAK